MKLSDFILLEADEKKSVVLHQGVLVGKRNNDYSMIFLFRLSDYYVETYCSVETKAIEEFHVFNSLIPLTPYLESIEIDGLLQ
jgi:hypothetical protein